jgi:3-hydroxyisobutyrate dehydrogenase-like beta-hydroxyacid dehydrogenase
VDAPVSGIASGAVEGSLSIFVGSSPQTFERLDPVFRAVGRDIFYAGPVGAGQTVKIVNNLIAITTYGVLAEGMGFAQALGIDETRMLAIINSSSGESFSSRHWHEHQATRKARRDAGIAPWKISAKDLDLALALAREAGHGLPMTGLMSQLVVKS